MAEFTHSGGGDNRGVPNNPEHTLIPARTATPGSDSGQPSGGSRFRAWKAEMGAKSLFDRGKPKNHDEGQGKTGLQDAGGSAASGPSDMGGVHRDGKAAMAGEMGTVGTGVVVTLSTEEAPSAPAEFENNQVAQFTPRLYAVSAPPAKDEYTPSPGIEDTLLVTGAGSGAVRLDDNPVAAMKLNTTDGTPQAHGAETIPPPMAANDLQETMSSFQPQATLASVATSDDDNPLQKTTTPISAEKKRGAHNMKEGIEGSPVPATAMARSVVDESTPAKKSSKALAIAMGTFKTALGIAAALIPEPFKGPAEALLKVVDVVEKADSNKEEVEILKQHCELLGTSIVNAVKGKDTKLLSEDLKDSLGRLVVGIWDTLEIAIKEKSEGITAYVLVEDDVEILENANKKLDKLLQCFWIENHIAGTIILSDILATVQDQGGWMQGLSAALDKHVENVADKIVTCLEGTRSTLLVNVGCWMSGSVSDSHSPPLYVLDGIAGIGKSTVAMTVAQRAAGINSLGATFFFSRDQDDRKKSLGFVHTIAYQLAHYDASYGTAIAAAITRNPEALDKVLTQQFSLLVAKPLWTLLEQRATPLVLVFDALDECIEPDASAVLKLIMSSVCQLPNIKVFLTTRPELGLRSKYAGTKEASVFHLQEIEDLIVEHDISLYVLESLSAAKIEEALGDSYNPHWQPTKEAKTQRVKMSGKLFIFASTALKFVLDDHELNPKAQLNKLIYAHSQGTSQLSELDKLYLYILESAKPGRNAENWLDGFKKTVGAVLVLQVPLSASVLERLLDEEPYTIKARLAHLHAILAPVGEGLTLAYRVHHKSFPDFVTGPLCPPEFKIIEEEQHLDLARYCLQVMNKKLKFNICQVASQNQYKELDDLLNEGLDTDCIPKELEYALCYWANHLSKLSGMDLSLITLLDEFAKNHLMHWLEALAYIKQLDIAQTALKEALSVLVCDISVVLMFKC
ncbi:hypothetical protein H1R20_g13846, partial [Candolleomyces eurysporus]